MIVKEFFEEVNLEDTFILGFYGGTNFGDELLLEVIQNKLFQKRYKKISFYYSHPDQYQTYHKDYGYSMLLPSKWNLIKALFTHKRIVLGGGGFWGLDFGMSTFFMSCYLFIARYVFFKSVYLVGVGFYDSATVFGRFGAFLAGLGANMIIARDDDTYNNFKSLPFLGAKTSKDTDIALALIGGVDEADYVNEISIVESMMKDKSVFAGEDIFFLGLRRFKDVDILRRYTDFLRRKEIDLANVTPILFEDVRRFDSEYEALFVNFESLRKDRMINFEYNPLAFFFFLQRHRTDVQILAPQFHVIMLVLILDMKHEGVAYDFKVSELFRKFDYDDSQISKLYEFTTY